MIREVYDLIRGEDPTGVSGTGIVADVVEFDDGTTVVKWFARTVQRVSSVVIYQSLDDAIKVHGHGGATEFRPRGARGRLYGEADGS